MIVNIQSDVFAQVKPASLQRLKELVKSGSRHSKFKFNGSNLYTPTASETVEIWAVQYLNFTNQQVHDLLSKSVSIVESTEEYTLHMLNEAFNDGKGQKKYSTPPGTLRIYAKDLICFYNGKTWRALKP
jgi:hypothetical protein